MNRINRKKTVVSLLIIAALALSTLGMLVPKVHAQGVTITEVSTRNTVVAAGFIYQGTVEIHILFPVDVVLFNSEVTNQTVTVGIYIDGSLTGAKQEAQDVMPGETRTLQFFWDTTGATLGNHTLSAQIDGQDPVIDGTIQVIFPGDVDQNGIVDMRDVEIIVQSMGAFYDNPARFNPFADLDGSGRIDLRDVGIWALNFGRSYALP